MSTRPERATAPPWARITVVAAIALLTVAAWPGAVRAHANLDRSDPADGEQLDTPPQRLSVTFTERPDPALSSIQLLDANGSVVATGALGPSASVRPRP